MTQIFAEDGRVTPVTTIRLEPMKAIRQKTVDKDGYEATVFGYGVQKESRINKPQRPLGNFRAVTELRDGAMEQEPLAIGDVVSVTGVSKGKGFQGVVKRHGFHGGSRTHGQKHSEREAGSIGGGGRAGGRVAKGMRMAGRMGGEQVTVQNLEVVGIDTEEGTVLLSGAVPGRRGTLIKILVREGGAH